MAITVDQPTLGHNEGGVAFGSSINLTTTAAVAPRATIVLYFSWNSATETLSSVAGGNLIWEEASFNVGNIGLYSIYIYTAYAPNGLASGSTITVTFTGTVDIPVVFAASFNRVLAISPIYDAQIGVDTDPPANDTWDGGTLTATQAGDLVVSYCFEAQDGSRTHAPATDYIESHEFGNSTFDTHAAVYRIVTAAGSYTPGGTWNNDISNGWGAVSATFLASPPEPLFVGAGDGATLTTGTAAVSKTGCIAGNVILIHLMIAGTTDDWSDSNVVNMENLSGVDNTMTLFASGRAIGSGPSRRQAMLVGRVIANGTCSIDFTVGVSGEDLFIRIYEFVNVFPGTTVESIMENDDATFQGEFDTGTDIGDCYVLTHGEGRRACNFVALADDLAIGNFTGETGGDWIEAVAEYVSSTGATGTLQLQTATMSSAGTITGGSSTVGVSADWGTLGLALLGPPSIADDAPLGFGGRGAGW